MNDESSKGEIQRALEDFLEHREKIKKYIEEQNGNE